MKNDRKGIDPAGMDHRSTATDISRGILLS